MNNEKSSLDQKIELSNTSGDLSENNPEHEMASSVNEKSSADEEVASNVGGMLSNSIEEGLDCVRMDEESIKIVVKQIEARSLSSMKSKTLYASKMTVGQLAEFEKETEERSNRLSTEGYSSVLGDSTPADINQESRGASAIETESNEEVQAETRDSIKRDRRELMAYLMQLLDEKHSLERRGHGRSCVCSRETSTEEAEPRSSQSQIEDTTETCSEWSEFMRKYHEAMSEAEAFKERDARRLASVKIDQLSRNTSNEETEARSQPSLNEEEVQPKTETAFQMFLMENAECLKRYHEETSRLKMQLPSTDRVDSEKESTEETEPGREPLTEEEVRSKIEEASVKVNRDLAYLIAKYLERREEEMRKKEQNATIQGPKMGPRHSRSSSSSSSDYDYCRFSDTSDSDSINSFLNNDFPSESSDWSSDGKITIPWDDQSSTDSQDSIWDIPRCSQLERPFKVLIIGDVGVGKTSIIQKYTRNASLGDYRATIGMDYFSKELILEDKTLVHLHIWDIAGSARLSTLSRIVYRGAHGAMVVCDATRRATIQNAVRWKDDLDERAILPDGSPIPCVLLANKCDLEVNSVVRNDSEMKLYCKKNRLLTWFETSAKDGTGIKEAFDLLVKEMMKHKRVDFGLSEPDAIRLSSETTTTTKKSKCLCS